MKGTPLMQQLVIESRLVRRLESLSGKFAAHVRDLLTLEQLEYLEGNLDQLKVAAKRGLESVEFTPQPPNLRSVGASFGSLLTARQNLEEFFTGEKLDFREIFKIPQSDLARNDIVPVYRGAREKITDVIRRCKMLDIDVDFEVLGSTRISKFRDQMGGAVPRLGYIRRSIEPPMETTPSGGIYNNLDLYGWLDANSFLHLIRGEHLDSTPKGTSTACPHSYAVEGYYAHVKWDPSGQRVQISLNVPTDNYPNSHSRVITYYQLR